MSVVGTIDQLFIPGTQLKNLGFITIEEVIGTIRDDHSDLV